MELPKDWARIQREYEREQFWREKGELAIRQEMERRLAAYEARKPPPVVAGPELVARRAEAKARAARDAAEESQRVADAIRAGRIVPRENVVPLLGQWNNGNRENQRRVAMGLPRIREENELERQGYERGSGWPRRKRW